MINHKFSGLWRHDTPAKPTSPEPKSKAAAGTEQMQDCWIVNVELPNHAAVGLKVEINFISNQTTSSSSCGTSHTIIQYLLQFKPVLW